MDGARSTLWKILLWTIVNHSKWIHLAQQFFDFHAWVKKCHFGNFSERLKLHLTHAWKSHFSWTKCFQLKWQTIVHYIFFHKVLLAPSKCLFKWIKMDKLDYLKKGSRHFKNSFYFGIKKVPSMPGTYMYMSGVTPGLLAIKIQIQAVWPPYIS